VSAVLPEQAPQEDTGILAAQARPPLRDRIQALFAEQLSSVHRRTDRLFTLLMGFQWIGVIVFAVWLTPRTPAHARQVGAAVILGGLIAGFPVLLASWRPGATVTRLVIAVAQMLMSSLLIHLVGTPETHFHVFG